MLISEKHNTFSCLNDIYSRNASARAFKLANSSLSSEVSLGWAFLYCELGFFETSGCSNTFSRLALLVLTRGDRVGGLGMPFTCSSYRLIAASEVMLSFPSAT